MSITRVDKDCDSLTLTVVADFDAPLERCGGCGRSPGSWNAGGTGPEGEKSRGWWRVTSVNPPKSLEFTDGFASQDGTHNADMPITRVYMQLTEHGGGTRMELRSVFDSRAQQLVTMGVDQWSAVPTA
jgi:uncharacterized protein YndB with AHSA1/START domain